MNDRETTQIIAMIETNWQPFKNTSAAVKLWASAFAEDPYELVNAAVMTLIQTDPSEFKPTIAMVRRKMHDIVYGKSISESEAWQLVRGSFHEAQTDPENLGGARSAWKKLPAEIQKLVSPRQLMEWGWMDTAQVDSVIQSNFMRSYREVRDRKYESEALPKATTKMISAIRQAAGLYSDPDKGKLPEPQIRPELPEKRQVEMNDKRKAMMADFLGGR